MVVVKCSVPSCTFETEDVSEALAIALLANHGLAHQTAPAAIAEPTQTPSLRGPKLERPKVDVGVSIEEWNVFVRRWEVISYGLRHQRRISSFATFPVRWSRPWRTAVESETERRFRNTARSTRIDALSCGHSSRHMCPTHRTVADTPGTR